MLRPVTTPLVACRACGSQAFEPVLSLGEQPLANALVHPEHLDRPELKYPLDLVVCPDCSTAQITVSVPPEQLFREYLYFSSFATTVVEHNRALARRVVRERSLSNASLVVEVASNDGYLLQSYLAEGVPVLGIEPAENVAAVARERGVETVSAFFGLELAEKLRASDVRADVLHAHNVMAHVPDIDDFIAGMAHLLAPDGVIIVETPYVRELVEKLEFDTIYHEHLFYYSITSVSHLFRRHGLSIIDVERVTIHGGTLRVWAARAEGAPTPSPRVAALLAEEDEIGLPGLPYYRDFSARVNDLLAGLSDLLFELQGRGASIAAYGAAAKGAVMLNALGPAGRVPEWVADRNPAKQGLYMPGTHQPVFPPERIVEQMPDYLLVNTWNFLDEIVNQESEYRARGGRFIVPVPEPRVLEP
jgi:2-polyprenyl-3-methyl-5-hydroxy-6-metoxy-1,4-benzoquinol methylase